MWLERGDLRAAWVGERWRIGTCLLGMFGRFGTYLRIAGERTLAAVDDVELVSRPEEQLTVRSRPR